MFYWAYLALRAGGQAAMEEAISTGDWTGPAFIEAGEQFQRLIDLEPFQEGFLAAAYNADQASTMGNGKAAMELMGQWAPGVEEAESESGEGIGDALGWFPFPAVEGGAGARGSPGSETFVVGQSRVQQRGFCAEALSQACDELWCESDFGCEHEDLLALVDNVAHAVQVNLGFAAARDPFDKRRGKSGAGSQCGHGRLLCLVQIGSGLGLRCQGFVEVSTTLLAADNQSFLE